MVALRRALVPTLLLTTLALNCNTRGKMPAPQEESTTLVGTVRVAGSTPFPQVLLHPEEDGPEVEIQGAYRSELRNLQGARVRVTGRLGAGNVLNASGYEILEIGGQKPLVGLLLVEGETTLLRTGPGEPVTLRGAPEELRALAGDKVWVITGRDGGVQAYGLIRRM